MQCCHCPCTPALFPQSLMVGLQSGTPVPRSPCDVTRNYDSQRPPRGAGIGPGPQWRLQLPGPPGSWATGAPEAAGGEQLAETGVVWVPVRVGRRRHAASQGFDAGAQPSQHRRSPKHPVSAQPGPERRALARGGARLPAGGVGKEPHARRRLVVRAVFSGTLRGGPSGKGKSASA